MDVNKLIPVTEYSLRDFREAKEENKLRSIYMERWLEGNLYRRDFLTENGWQIVANFNEDDLER